MKIAVGIDSIDSPYGGCTTHFLYRVFRRLYEKGYVGRLLEYPLLVRLNPSIPHKTRGNGAVALKFEFHGTLDRLVDEILEEFEEYSTEVLSDRYKAGIVIAPYELAGQLQEIYLKSLTDYVHLDYVREAIRGIRDELILPLGLNRGCVGALAALGWASSRCTYELLAYRDPNLVGTSERLVSSDSLAKLESSLEYETFCSYDYDSGRAVSIPRGPDPILIGIRGLDPEKLVKALNFIELREPVMGWIVFKTNQATGEHMVPRTSQELKPFRTGCVIGVVSKVTILPGGDILISLSDSYGECLASIFKETGLTKYAHHIITGDVIRVCGSVKLWEGLGAVLHTELIEILELAERYVRLNPRCPKCGARLKSAGSGKGYKCLKCGYRSRELAQELHRLPREITVGTYLPSCGSVKHLGIPSSIANLTLTCLERIPEKVSDFYYGKAE